MRRKGSASAEATNAETKCAAKRQAARRGFMRWSEVTDFFRLNLQKQSRIGRFPISRPVFRRTAIHRPAEHAVEKRYLRKAAVQRDLQYAAAGFGQVTAGRLQ